MKMKWLSSYETGHPEIDDQHRNLIDLINLISDAIRYRDVPECNRLLSSFVEFAENHFETEERILRQIDFPGLEKHRVYHRRLLKQAEEARKLCYEMAETGRFEECFHEMAAFFVDDVVRGDMEFVSHLIEAGLASEK